MRVAASDRGNVCPSVHICQAIFYAPTGAAGRMVRQAQALDPDRRDRLVEFGNFGRRETHRDPAIVKSMSERKLDI